MNLNILGYIIFLLITTYIIIVVGKICYRNGNIFVLELIPNHKELCQQINKILLISYYLINIGYCAMTLISWSTITNSTGLVAIIASKASIIVGILAILHYLNIFILTNYIQKLIK